MPATVAILAKVNARLDALDNRTDEDGTRHRRPPPPFPITVVETVDDQTVRKVNKVSYGWSRHRTVHRERGDRDLHSVHEAAMAAFTQRLDRCADQFCKMRERLLAVEAKQQGATP